MRSWVFKIINRISNVRIYSGKEVIDLKLKESNIVLDRKKFDSSLADKAIKSGAKIFLNYKFINHHQGISTLVQNKKTVDIKSDILIGADGPLSRVAKSSGLFGKRKFLTGIQAIAKRRNDNAIEFYPSIGAFAWVVPEDDSVCRIGIAAYNNTAGIFDQFLDKMGIKKKNISVLQGGLIPIYSTKQRIQKDEVYLLGDAAQQVKATTGGGIIQGLKAGRVLTDSIIKGRYYQKERDKEMKNDLYLHLKMRQVMDRFKEKDWEKLLHLVNKPKIRNILEEFDRDYPTAFAAKLLLNEPRLLLFGKFLL